jgi:ribosomal protein S18 acetylase RimI-like enzyme
MIHNKNKGTALTQEIQVRPARQGDVPNIAALLVEGFGHEYGGVLSRPAGQRAIERAYQLPGRLHGVIVVVDALDRPIGVAGLRTRDLQPNLDQREQMVMMQELGIGRLLQLDLLGVLIDPPPYQVKRHEAFVYSVTVTQRWRGRGVADALMERLHAMAHGLGKTTVVLEVVENNVPARRLYARHGYVVRQRRRGLLAWLPFGVSPRLLLAKQLESKAKD